MGGFGELSSGEIKFGESLNGVHPKLYNCFKNNASSACVVPLIKLIEAVTPCSEACLPTLYLWAHISMSLVRLLRCVTFAILALTNLTFIGTDLYSMAQLVLVILCLHVHPAQYW